MGSTWKENRGIKIKYSCWTSLQRDAENSNRQEPWGTEWKREWGLGVHTLILHGTFLGPLQSHLGKKGSHQHHSSKKYPPGSCGVFLMCSDLGIRYICANFPVYVSLYFSEFLKNFRNYSHIADECLRQVGMTYFLYTYTYFIRETPIYIFTKILFKFIF